MLRRTFLLLGLVIFLSSCSENYIFHKKFEVLNSSWSESDPAIFDLEINLDTSSVFDLLIAMNIDDGYEYQNIYTQISTTFPDGSSIKDIISFDLADKAGFWKGDCSGHECEILFTLQKNVKFQEKGKYQFSITPHMRVNPVEHINSISLMLANKKD